MSLPKGFANNFWRIPWHWLLIFVFSCGGIIWVGYWYYEQQTAIFLKEEEAELSAIADLKVKTISYWREERRHDALTLLNDYIFAREVNEWLESKDSPLQQDKIISRLAGLKQNIFEQIALLDTQGTLRLAVPDNNPDLFPMAKQLSLQAINTKQIVFSDFYFLTKHNVRFSVLVPLHYHKKDKTVYVGTILMEIDPEKNLFPIINIWPTPSATAEIILLQRKENENELVNLNPLRQREGPGLLLRVPLSETQNPGVQAAKGHEGIVRGIDYRGVPVLAATRKIPHSPWFLVAKIDLAELYAPLKEQREILLFALSALIVCAGLGFTNIWRQRNVQFFRQLYLVEAEQRSLAQRYEYLAQNANDIILVMDRNLMIIEANHRALASYGYSHDEFRKLSFGDLFLSSESLVEGQNLEMDKPSQMFEAVHRRKDNTTFPVEISCSLMETNEERFYQCIIRDISERKQAENTLHESEQQLRYISSQLLIVQEEERHRISKELHDELGQGLAVTRYQLSSIESRLSKRSVSLRNDCQNLLNYLEGLIEKVRRLSWDLTPAAIEQFGLTTAIKNLLEEFSNLDIQWLPGGLSEIDHIFSPLGEINIYRIFQETLTNIARHAQASRVSINIERHHGLVRFSVKDDGKGFDWQEIINRQERKNGIGLAIMQERAHLAGGSLEILSQPSSGTEIIFTIPVMEGGENGFALPHPPG